MNQKQHGVVLVVDDDPAVLEVVSLQLNEYGYAAIACNSSREALNRFQNLNIDTVVTDIIMPLTSGIELLEKIHDIDSEVPVILMTAYADLGKAVEAIKKGAFDFLIKPYAPQQLVHSVGKAVNYRKLSLMEKEYKKMLEDLNQAMETLVAERTMGLMALTIADKVRNPATVIGCQCRRILEKEDVSDTLRESLKNVISEAKKLDTIVRDFQNILKNRQSMYEYGDINEIMKGVISVIEREAAYKNIGLTITIPEDSMKMNMHKNLLRVAIFHILRNAIEATPEAGKITVSACREGDTVVVSISDTGPGISEENVDRIFDPFFTTKEHRFGMGLPLVKQIVSEHMGDIKIESEIGKGVTFKMIFSARWK